MTHKGIPDGSRAARLILKDYVNGKLLYCYPPPGYDTDEFQQYATRYPLSNPDDRTEKCADGQKDKSSAQVRGIARKRRVVILDSLSSSLVITFSAIGRRSTILSTGPCKTLSLICIDLINVCSPRRKSGSAAKALLVGWIIPEKMVRFWRTEQWTSTHRLTANLGRNITIETKKKNWDVCIDIWMHNKQWVKQQETNKARHF
jgi:hypothetical protein